MENEIRENAYEEDDGWKLKTILAGGIIGALTGVGAGYLMVRKAEQEGLKLTISSGQGLKLGGMLAGLIRSLLSLND